ncbi:MAG TPA: DUF3418 domain-containing protein, partial [Rhodanobacteraceae bacterium]|nr:DUF3418 domain-containing protein [Rhodanobacteraceae bacterium]
AMRLRAMRLREDPRRDQTRMLIVQGLWRDYLGLKDEPGRDRAALAEVRWMIEELRVSLFAQELRTPEPVSAKRVTRALAALRGG